MLHNIMSPIVNRPGVTLARYDIHHALPTNTNALIGRAAHIAVLDSELFIEKFLIVAALKYFQWIEIDHLICKMGLSMYETFFEINCDTTLMLTL